jgi:CDP-diacylglycerol--serine O-phosphatidyltransferase
MDKPRHFSMIREFHLADFLTLGNAACGVGAVFLAMLFVDSRWPIHFFLACALLPAAFAFDVFDGKVARSRNQHSALGRELDSLADVISFGVAPAAMAYGVGMQGFWDVAVLLSFVACGISRLARYNITAEELANGAEKPKYFEGTPIPSSLILVAVLALAIWNGRVGEDLWAGSVRWGAWTLHPLVAMFALSGSLMISKTIRIPKL